MPWPGPGHLPFGSRIAENFASGHDFFPVRPVPVLDHHGNGTANGLSVADPRQKPNLILFDLHPPAAPIAPLPAFEFMINEVKIDGKMRWEALHQGDQGRAVRLAGRSKAQHPLSIAEFSVTMASMPVSPKAAVKEVQDLSFLTGKAFASMFRRPYYVRDILMQMDLIGVGSLTVVMLTGFFTGAVLTLQTSFQLSRFGAVGFTGGLVSVSLVRELGPVLAALMVAGRVGSGMASELGSMLVTE